jgi:hypothetical protein
MKQLLDELISFSKSNQLVHLERLEHFENMEGFVHNISNELILVQQVVDFSFVGYTVMRIADIVGIRSDENERFYLDLLNKEGVSKFIGCDQDIPIDNWLTCLSYFIKRAENIIVECEPSGSSQEEVFQIGKACEIQDGKTLWFLGFDSLGQWEIKEHPILIDYISQVQFDTRYINVYSKYVR